MKMSQDYMAETANFLATCGYKLVTRETHYGDGANMSVGTNYVLQADEQRLVLETVVAANGTENFFLEIQSYHGLRSYSFLLDSWKYSDSRIEFKFYVLDETGTGLSFIIDLTSTSADKC